MPSLLDFKIVDLKRSKFDRAKADPVKGRYYFSDKHYLKNSDYNDIDVRPAHVLTWVRFDKTNDFIEMKMWESQWSAEAVHSKDMLYWPEPLTPRPDDTYVWQDAILMQVPLDVWLQKRREDKERYDRESKRNKEEFKEIAKNSGAEIEMDDEVIRKIGI